MPQPLPAPALHFLAAVYIYSADGRYLLSGGADGRLCVWDARTGLVVNERQTDHVEVSSVAITADGGEVFCGRQDGTVEVWEFVNGTLASEPTVFARGHGSEVAVAVSPDGRWIAGAYRDSELAIWSRADGRRVRFSEKHPSHCRTCIFARDGRMLVATVGNSICRLDLERGEWLEEVIVDGFIDSFGLSPDGTWLAAVGADGRVLRLDLETGQCAELWRQGPGVLHEVDFSPDGRYLLTAGDDERLCIWEVATGRLVSQVKAHSGVVWTAAFSPDGEAIASCGADNAVRLHRAVDLLGPEQVFASTQKAASLSFSPDSKTLIVGEGVDGGLTVWDVANWCVQRQVKSEGSPQYQLLVLANDWLLLLENEGHLALVDPDQTRFPFPAQLPATVYSLCAHSGTAVIGMVLHGRPNMPHGGYAVYDSGKQNLLWQWPFPEGLHYCMQTSDGSSALFVGVSGKTELVTAGRARTLDFMLPPAETGWGGAAWTLDSKTLAYVEAKANISLVDVATGEQLGQLIAHDKTITALACSPDSRILASGDAGGTVHFWDLTTSEQAGTLHASGAVRTLEFSPNGRLLAAIF